MTMPAAAPGPSWDILLPTIPHRHEQMCALLAEIDKQHQPGLAMLALRDNLERPGNASYAKWQELTELSSADYISFIGDDDWVAPDFVARIMTALASKPDYVGFPVRYTYNGVPQVPVEHSLAHSGWLTTSGQLYRDIVHHNPIRRELALLATWRTEQGGDSLWADDLRATGQVRTEIWIPEPMYYYQETSNSWTRWGGPPQPLPEDQIPPMPEYPWLTSYGK
jgi:hypothetical protein